MTDMRLSQESIRVRAQSILDELAELERQRSEIIVRLVGLQDMCRHTDIDDLKSRRVCADCKVQILD